MEASEPNAYRAALPMPLPETKQVDYYAMVLGLDFGTAQTEEYTIDVTEGGCDLPAAPLALAGSIVLRATVASQAPIPAGFSAEGITSFVTTTGQTVSGAALGEATAGSSAAAAPGTGATAAAGSGISAATVGIVAGAGAAAAVGGVVAASGNSESTAGTAGAPSVSTATTSAPPTSPELPSGVNSVTFVAADPPRGSRISLGSRSIVRILVEVDLTDERSDLVVFVKLEPRPGSPLGGCVSGALPVRKGNASATVDLKLEEWSFSRCPVPMAPELNAHISDGSAPVGEEQISVQIPSFYFVEP